MALYSWTEVITCRWAKHAGLLPQVRHGSVGYFMVSRSIPWSVEAHGPQQGMIRIRPSGWFSTTRPAMSLWSQWVARHWRAATPSWDTKTTLIAEEFCSLSSLLMLMLLQCPTGDIYLWLIIGISTCASKCTGNCASRGRPWVHPSHCKNSMGGRWSLKSFRVTLVARIWVSCLLRAKKAHSAYSLAPWSLGKQSCYVTTGPGNPVTIPAFANVYP